MAGDVTRWATAACALPSPANWHSLAFCLSWYLLLTIYALLLVPVQDFIRSFKVLIVLPPVLAFFSLFIQVVMNMARGRKNFLRRPKEKG